MDEKEFKRLIRGKTGVRERWWSSLPNVFTADQYRRVARDIHGVKVEVVDSDTHEVKVERTDNGYEEFQYDADGKLIGRVEVYSRVDQVPIFAKKR